MLSRFENAFPSDPSKAFSKHTRTSVEPSRFHMGGKEVKHPEFSESAISAFGKRSEAHHGSFQEDASQAFGKKPEEQHNSYGARMQHIGVVSSNEWSSSALRKIEKPSLEIDSFPALSSIDLFPPLGSSPSAKKDASPKVSFVHLVKKRAEDDAKEAEEAMKRELKQREILTKRQEELARRKLVHTHYVEQSKLLNRTVQNIEEDDAVSIEDEPYPDHDDEESVTEDVQDEDDCENENEYSS